MMGHSIHFKGVIWKIVPYSFYSFLSEALLSVKANSVFQFCHFFNCGVGGWGGGGGGGGGGWGRGGVGGGGGSPGSSVG